MLRCATRELIWAAPLWVATSAATSDEPDGTDDRPLAATAWFTDCEIDGSVRGGRPDDRLPSSDGTEGEGSLLTHGVPIANPLLRQDQGIISFWLRPDWDGDDGMRHALLRIGDPERNGLSLAKAESGMLRYVMASASARTAARADVSHWKAGEWHHIAIAWMSRNEQPLALALWIDKTAVAGPIVGLNDFLDPAVMDDARVWIGDTTSDAVMDELIMRDRFDIEGNRQLGLVYRDYFRTAPYEEIEIDHESSSVPADRRVIAGFTKQFGLLAGADDDMVRITDFTVRYGCWSNFDAKPFIRWATSDGAIATVDDNGLVTGVAPGRCKLLAEFRGMEAKYDLTVIPADRPDLDLIYVERLPRYANDGPKLTPESGDTVQFVANVLNAGFEPVPRGAVVRFELIPDANRNFRLDADEDAVHSEDAVIDHRLRSWRGTTVTFSHTWTREPVWVRITLDPDGRIPELCEANNACADLNMARPVRFGYDREFLESCYAERKINLVGSFSYYDYINAQKRRTDVMVREAIHPETSPIGIRDSFRTDLI